jgi:hypothetical protein
MNASTNQLDLSNPTKPHRHTYQIILNYFDNKSTNASAENEIHELPLKNHQLRSE